MRIIGLLTTFSVLSSVAVTWADEVNVAHNDVQLNADLVVADGNNIADGIFILVHGTLGHKNMEIVEALQSTLRESGRNSLAINLSLNINDRQGFYSCDNRHSHRYEDAISELATWANWLTEQGANEMVLLGHSRGANQAAKYVLSGDTPISALVLLAPPATDVVIHDDQLQRLSSMQPTDWLSHMKFLHCDDSDVQVASFLSYVGPDAQNDTVALLGELHMPTLVISGSEDDVVPDLSARMASADTAYVSHIEIDGADHFFRDLYMYDVVDAVDLFLDTAKR